MGHKSRGSGCGCKDCDKKIWAHFRSGRGAVSVVAELTAVWKIESVLPALNRSELSLYHKRQGDEWWADCSSLVFLFDFYSVGVSGSTYFALLCPASRSNTDGFKNRVWILRTMTVLWCIRDVTSSLFWDTSSGIGLTCWDRAKCNQFL